ncbi:hypothetical protein HYU07_03825 [Candidatus Woesearchaeota archaeon]|nr:hypothetical protein [Candidatus Woesearchaeota archaeon]
MVEILEKIPVKQARMIRVPKERPAIFGEPGYEDIIYGGLTVPSALNRRFLQKCSVDIRASEDGLTQKEVKERIRQTNADKDLYLRFAGSRPLSVVTDSFIEISPREIAKEASKLIGKNPAIRYFRNNESLQFNFPLNTRFKGINLVLNTGDYGVYGGSGLDAVSYGISWYNRTCSNWTIFLNKAMKRGIGRVIHRRDDDLAKGLIKATALVSELEGKIDESRDKRFTFNELNDYFDRYEGKGLNKKIADQIRQESPLGISAYDLSYKLTLLCQDEKLSDITRARIEFLAGEVILCYDSIKNGLFTTRRVGSRLDSGNLPKRYVGLN